MAWKAGRRGTRTASGSWWPATGGGQTDLVLVPAEPGQGAEQYLVEHPSQESFAVFSPDGRRLAFLSDRKGGWAIYTQDMRENPKKADPAKAAGSP